MERCGFWGGLRVELRSGAGFGGGVRVEMWSGEGFGAACGLS